MKTLARGGRALLVAAVLACGEAGEPDPTAEREPVRPVVIDAPADAVKRCLSLLPAIGEGFGARGPFEATAEAFPNPLFPEVAVSVHLPAGVDGPVPVVFFAHAYDASEPGDYAALVGHVVSRGLALVFSPYAVASDRHADRYAALWAGFAEAARRLGDRLDLSRVGLVGHSYGAGALPWVAHRALVEEGWGGAGAFLYLMAPWYPLQTSPERMAELPAHASILVQVFEDDTANDHRIAIDLFHALGSPEAERDYVLVRSDEYEGCPLDAFHTVPQSRGLHARQDGLDSRAIFRPLDALAAFAFEGDDAGRRAALGHGAPEQTDMGRWPDGRPVAPLVPSRDPKPVRPESQYLFRASERAKWAAFGERAEPDPGESGSAQRGAAERSPPGGVAHATPPAGSPEP